MARRSAVRSAAQRLLACLLLAATGCGGTANLTAAGGEAARAEYATQPATYAALAASAVSVLEHGYYAGAGLWNMCLPARCHRKNFDWGADSLTYALYLHWQLTHDRRVRPIMRALARTAARYGPAGYGWSDVPEWDAIADIREYQVTGDPAALAKAKAAFAVVDRTAGFASGACPSVDYQRPNGGPDRLKTLETDSNYIKAALLLYQVTRDPAYLAKAESKYAAVRIYFLGAGYPLYTVYVFDNGSRCARLPHRYYASVNGNMIWAGVELAAATGQQGYLVEAEATARSVVAAMGDARGVYADLQAENDVSEPLVEAMYLLATADHQLFARRWLLRAASAAAADRTGLGTYGRFFDGPPPRSPVTAWQGNGGLALMIAAAKLDPLGRPADPDYWRRAVFVSDNQRLRAGGAVRVTFTGRAIAIIGTIGELCCQPGHARLFIDGTQSFDRTGIWQDKSSSGLRLPGSVLFAWRWATRGRHVITFRPARFNAKEGGTFFHMTGYLLVR